MKSKEDEQIIIRMANRSDYEGINNIHEKAFKRPVDYYFYSHHFLVATNLKGDIYSYLCFRTSSKDDAFGYRLAFIGTKEDKRNQGIASLLIEKLKMIAIDDMAETIDLTVREHNEIARELYKKADFIEKDIKEHYYNNGDNAIILEYNCLVRDYKR